MSGQLSHSPAQLVRQFLVDLSGGNHPDSGESWPIYCHKEPDNPDNVVTVYTTQGLVKGWQQIEGEAIEHYGVMIRIRSTTAEVGYVQADLIRHLIDTQSSFVNVRVDDAVYRIESIDRTSAILPLGAESPTSARHLYTINATTSLRRL